MRYGACRRSLVLRFEVVYLLIWKSYGFKHTTREIIVG